MRKVVLIMDDMPERCNDCYAAYMSTTGTFICRAVREKLPPKPRKRPDWCPLLVLPEEMLTDEAIQIVKRGEKGITADKNFARGIANFTEKHLKNDLIRIAEENWTDSQVKMLKGLICAAVNGIEYSDAYEVVNRD